MKNNKCIGCKKKFKPLIIELHNLILSSKTCNECRSNDQLKTKAITEPVHKSFFNQMNDDFETDEDRVVEYYSKLVL